MKAPALWAENFHLVSRDQKSGQRCTGGEGERERKRRMSSTKQHLHRAKNKKNSGKSAPGERGERGG